MTLLTLLQSPTGSGTIGTLSATLGAATLSSNGTLTAGATGTLAGTLGAVTLSSNGTLTASVTGTLSATLGLLTLSAQGVLPGAVPADEGSKGGWDPYFYKKRNKRRDQRRDVVKFIEEVAAPQLVQAPDRVQEQAQEALEAARLALTLNELDAMQKALREINEFYALVRAEAKRLRDEEDEEELLLLAA